jgi:hypothetical protein
LLSGELVATSSAMSYAVVLVTQRELHRGIPSERVI